MRDYRLYRSPDGTRKNLAPATASDATSYAYYGERLVATYLDTTDSRVACSVAVEDGCRIYNIVATGTPRALADQAPNATFADYRAEALVTTSGRVTDLTVTYRFVGETESGRVRLWVHYRDYGTARVERPDWLSVFETGTDSEEETETNSAS